MSLEDMLSDVLTSVYGACFVGVVGTDGLGIRAVVDEGEEAYDLELAELEISALAASAAAASGRIGSGAVRSLTIEADGLTYLAVLLEPGYYAALCLHSEANVERGRQALYRLAEVVRSEL